MTFRKFGISLLKEFRFFSSIKFLKIFIEIEAGVRKPLQQRARFIYRLNCVSRESLRIAEIKFWSCYFLLVDYIDYRGIAHNPTKRKTAKPHIFVG